MSFGYDNDDGDGDGDDDDDNGYGALLMTAMRCGSGAMQHMCAT